MDTNKKIGKLSFLKNQLLSEGPDNIKDVEPMIIQILKDIFGLGNEFYKKADKIMAGFIVSSSAKLMYEQVSKEEYNKEKFEMYMKLISQAEAYVLLEEDNSPYLNKQKNVVANNKKSTIFLSYCWDDTTTANEIDDFLREKGINITRDIRGVDNWESLREFMQTIRENDFAVLLISDAYLKSINCMYEVLEIMKEPKYATKIFPAVINLDIYRMEKQIEYVKYWEDRGATLHKNLSTLQYTNGLALGQELKKVKDITGAIGEFMRTVSDMKNPQMQDVKESIYNKVK